MNRPTIKLELSPKAFKVITSEKPIKVLYGGRGGKKSFDFADYTILRSLEGARVLCLREYQNSIDESVHHLLESRIFAYDLGKYFKINKSSIENVYGGEFLFKGIARDINSIKSIADVDIAWVEEATPVSEYHWDMLIPSIRPRITATKPPEILVSFNPDTETDATFRLLVASDRQDVEKALVNYWDNPYFPEYLRNLMEECKRTDLDKYRHIWEGACCNFAGKIYKEFLRDKDELILQPMFENGRVVGCIKEGVEVRFMPYWNYYTGLDTGGKTGWVLKAIDDRQNEYIIDEIYDIDGLVRDISRDIKRLSEKRNIVGKVIDSASQVKREYEAQGLYMADSCKDVLGSIQKVRTKQSQHKWYVLSHCHAVINELKMREWDEKPDSRGKIYPRKEHDHLMNAEDYIQTTFLRADPPKVVTPQIQRFQQTMQYKAILRQRKAYQIG